MRPTGSPGPWLSPDMKAADKAMKKPEVKAFLRELFMIVADACDGDGIDTDVADQLAGVYHQAMKNNRGVRDLYSALLGE